MDDNPEFEPAVIERISNSAGFAKSPRFVELLRFLSEETRRGSGPTAADIGTHLFRERGPDDGATAARILVLQLRRMLEEYYTREGRSDAIRLTVGSRPYRLVWVEQEVPVATARWLATPQAFSRMILAFCSLNGIDAAERTRRFRDWFLHSDEGSSLQAIARFGQVEDFDEFLRKLQERDLSVSVRDLRAVTALFGIHPLLLDSLLIEANAELCLSLDLKDDFLDVSESGDRFRGRAATYRVARRKLARADSAILSITLERGGETDSYAIPGDELIYVRSGIIEVVFDASGVRTVLHHGDIIHFYAEQRHQVVAQQRAELLIARSYPLDSPVSRQALSAMLKHALAGEQEAQLPDYTLAWVRQLLPDIRAKSAGVSDTLGLARLLHRCKPNPPKVPALPENERAALEAARPDIQSEVSLAEIAATYGVASHLLENYVAPGVPNLVVIRRDEWTEMRQALPPGVRYWLPPRNLSCSDIALARVRLQPNAATSTNQHPGLELLLVLAGSVELHLDEDTCTITASAQQNQLCHFDSSRRHTILNPSIEPSEFLVFRFYEDGVAHSAV